MTLRSRRALAWSLWPQGVCGSHAEPLLNPKQAFVPPCHGQRQLQGSAPPAKSRGAERGSLEAAHPTCAKFEEQSFREREKSRGTREAIPFSYDLSARTIIIKLRLMECFLCPAQLIMLSRLNSTVSELSGSLQGIRRLRGLVTGYGSFHI